MKKLLINLILLILSLNIILMFSSAMAATYYVSSSMGSNSNNGLSPQTAWQNAEKFPEVTFAPGDFILFKRGDTWNYSIDILQDGAEGAPITYSSYGEGPRPHIHATTGPYGIHASIRARYRSHIVIDSFEISGTMSFGILFQDYSQLDQKVTSHITIKNCYIHDIVSEDWHCITGSGRNIKILNNTIARCGLEAFYGSGENIEIAYNDISETDMVSGDQCDGKGDAIQLNCWAPNYHVHHNKLDHSNTCGPKGAFISSHCAHDCYDNLHTPCTTEDDIPNKTSNGIFEHNEILSGPNDNFGFTNNGYGDIVRYNTFIGSGQETPPIGSEFALKSARGVRMHHNIIDNYEYGVSLGQEGSVFYIYNNLITNTGTTLRGRGDSRSVTVHMKNNLFLDFVQYYQATSSYVIHYSHNVATEGFGSGRGGTHPILDDQGSNMTMDLSMLLLKDAANGDYTPATNSPLINSGTYVGLPAAGGADIGPYNLGFSWPIFLPALLYKNEF